MGFAKVVTCGFMVASTLGCGAPRAGSASKTSGEAAGDEPRFAQPTADEQRKLTLFARLGHAIFAQDDASARGTDAMLELTRGEPDPRLRGWVTLETEAGFRVVFVASSGDRLLVVYEVDVPHRGPVKAVELQPPAPAPPEVAVRFRAHQTVLAHGFRACSARYNQVVLPGALIGEAGWLVYELAATVDPAERVIGGHHRFLVSEDGTRVLASMALSKDCMTLRPPPDAVALAVTSLVSDMPNESHFFVSMLYRTPVYVLAGGQIWKIRPGR